MTKIKPIVKEPNKILRAIASPLALTEIKSRKIQELIADMKETLKNTPDGVGLAAPQVGESLRIFIVSEEAEEIDTAEKKGWKRRDSAGKKKGERPYELREWKYYAYINPEVKKNSKTKLEGPEGCLSVPGKFGQVIRTEKITIEAYDEFGKKFTRGSSKFFARVVQHELDHLSGILFIDKAGLLYDAEKNSTRNE